MPKLQLPVALSVCVVFLPAGAGAGPKIGTLPELELKPTCKVIQRGGNVGVVADTNLFPHYPNDPFGTSERVQATGFINGPSGSSGSNARALLRFWLNAGVLPAGAIVQTAEVVLTPIEILGPDTVTVQLVTKDWDENTATAGNFPVATSTVATPFRTLHFDSHPLRFDVTQQFLEWTAGTTPNHGMLFATTGNFAAGSSESDKQPYLKFCYVQSPCGGQPDGKACKSRHTCTAAGSCQAGVCVGPPAAAGTICRSALEPCDVAETCDGVTQACPPQTLAATSLVCRDSAGKCDVIDHCDGNAFECPFDQLQGNSHTCRESDGECDHAEHCTGTSVKCPANAFEPSTKVCRGVDSGDECDVKEKCTGHDAACPKDKLKAAGTVCRDVAGSCDKAESCTGADKSCPSDTFKSSTTVCRGSAGVCDVDERCTGSSAQCPADHFASSSQVCRASTGTCDVDDRCTGSTAACPANQHAPDGQSCGAAQSCSGGQCRHCGGANEACCPSGASCSGTVTCQGGVCKTCGATGTACCTTGTPCSGQALCNAAKVCEPCGKAGQACCDGTSGCYENAAPCCTSKYSGGKYTCQPSPAGQVCP